MWSTFSEKEVIVEQTQLLNLYWAIGELDVKKAPTGLVKVFLQDFSENCLTLEGQRKHTQNSLEQQELEKQQRFEEMQTEEFIIDEETLAVDNAAEVA